MAPPRLPTQKERLANAQREWNNYQAIRKRRLRFMTNRHVGLGTYNSPVLSIRELTEEEKLDKKLLASSLEKSKVKMHMNTGDTSDLWFTGTNLLGDDSPRDIIGLLGLLATVNVGDKFIENCFHDLTVHSSAWLYKNHFEGHKADYPPWTAKNDDASLKLQQFHAMVDALAKAPGSPALWKRLNAMLRLSGYLMKILRFVDEQNPYLGRPALPDGSNIQSSQLKASWVLHRAWTRLLHCRSLSFGSRDRGVDQLKEILVIARAQLEQEIRKAPADSRNIPEGLVEFETTLENLTLFLEALATEFGSDSVPKPGARKPYSVSDFNIDPDRVGALWNEITQPVRPDPLGRIINPLGAVPLWSQLLDRAADFEDRNNRYYVEDHLFENRVIAEDEHWELARLLHLTSYTPDTIKKRVPDAVQQQYVKALARKVSQVNLNRRNFLLLRDWSKKRPWKQLYWVFDTVSTDSWREQIEDFYNTIEGLTVVPEHFPPDHRAKIEADPESEPNLFANVFPIHPIPSHNPGNYAGPYFGNCVYCLENYKPGELWLRFFCDHMVHYDCGRNAWDNSGNPDFRCPLCRHTQSWQLHKVAGIVPEVIDLWDNVDLVGKEEATIHPIVQMEGTPDDIEGFKELYWENEASHLALSEAWNPAIPRTLHDEMAHMRNARRKRVLDARKERIESELEYRTLAE
ncbi:hypothetical protein SBOR_4057 [Sclerotinia borealis F-4128]|uniref:RING-type domain-containing protein n=1 Tax=Sclerotinia borealis (strain F-4128) TaxID=1432307 RepID=W9CFP3_SCLBF|nr:hypothetical protein SBOR_4057 [Sclerotinia borealis F-4128]